MLKKNIEKNISEKIADFVSSINDKTLAKKVEESVIVAGGCIVSMLLGEKPKDYDLYISDIDVLLELAKYYKEYFSIKCDILDGRKKEELLSTDSDETSGRKNRYLICVENLHPEQIKLFPHGNNYNGVSIEQDVENPLRYAPTFVSPNAITLLNDVQIITRFTGAPAEILKNFDFAHTMNYYTKAEGLVLNQEALVCLLNKNLVYRGSKYPVTSLSRSKKFINRGFMIGHLEYLKIAFQISELDLTNLNTLEEQIIGVDVALTSDLIDTLRTKQQEEPNWSLTSDYLVELIDKDFSNE